MFQRRVRVTETVTYEVDVEVENEEDAADVGLAIVLGEPQRDELYFTGVHGREVEVF